MAPLTEQGILQVDMVANDPRLVGAEFIISSPYTRAMQTAAIISKKTGLDIKVETDLHEWLPDTKYQYDTAEYSSDSSKECTMFRGEHTEDCIFNFENLSNVAKRAFNVLYKYELCKKIIIVTHGIVMR